MHREVCPLRVSVPNNHTSTHPALSLSTYRHQRPTSHLSPPTHLLKPTPHPSHPFATNTTNISQYRPDTHTHPTHTLKTDPILPSLTPTVSPPTALLTSPPGEAGERHPGDAGAPGEARRGGVQRRDLWRRHEAGVAVVRVEPVREGEEQGEAERPVHTHQHLHKENCMHWIWW